MTASVTLFTWTSGSCDSWRIRPATTGSRGMTRERFSIFARMDVRIADEETKEEVPRRLLEAGEMWGYEELQRDLPPPVGPDE